MTWLEKLKTDGENTSLVDYYCPAGFFENAPILDGKTVIHDGEDGYDGPAIGCRGITCEECWAQEAKDASI